jgi:hypothetical protein
MKSLGVDILFRNRPCRYSYREIVHGYGENVHPEKLVIRNGVKSVDFLEALY